VPHTIIVDDFLPRTASWAGIVEHNIFASAGEDDSIWAAIIEKAFAKNFGNYYRLVENRTVAIDAMRTLTGAPYETAWHGDEIISEIMPNAYDEDQLFKLFEQRLEEGAILQTQKFNGPYASLGHGLSGGIYTVLGVI